MYDALRNILQGDDFSVIESFEIPGQPARYAAIPRFLFDSCVGQHLDRQFRQTTTGTGALWAHQALALNALGSGDNVVISTGTASGKSLVFQSLAFHSVLRDPDSRVLIFYPLKALAADQLRGWQTMAKSLELGEDAIGRIDGSVPQYAREDILRSARIIIMTPDVCQAWLMHRLSLPVVKDFVRSLSIVVMDEAHTLEGVFGSNFAFLIRRIIAARNHLLRDDATPSELQLVAATATITNPGEHLKRLTGADFTVVSHEDDGAPRSERIVAHVACPTGEELQVVRELHNRVLAQGSEGAFITFLDSRQGVERLARATQKEQNGSELTELLADADVLPYRAGYDGEDRQQIEQRLQSNTLQGVVSTSALELGIDIPSLRVGFNIGVPVTRKAYRQRLGRVGRSGPGVFVVVAPANEFRMYGTTFEEYHEMSVEPSYLYLDNCFMQFAHGKCLAIELESLGASPRTPTKVAWPRGFNDMHAAARPGGRRAQKFDAINLLGGDEPHYNYPLRNIGEPNYQIEKSPQGPDSKIGNMNLRQALRECYPGATCLHLARSYEVIGWRIGSHVPSILVKNGRPGRTTTPRIATWINTELTPADVLENHVLTGEHGFLAECEMLITERVEGFKDERGQFYSYEDLQSKNSNMRARSRNFRTSGIVLHLDYKWFKPSSVKQTFADRLRDVLVREYSISPQDIGSAASNISVRTLDRGRVNGGCVVVFDEIYGSLRLTERLYLNFEHVLKRMSAASETGSEDNALSQLDVERILQELSTFTVPGIPDNDTSQMTTPTGYEQVFTPGSRVCRPQGTMIVLDVEIIQPTIMEGKLMYQVKGSQKPGQPPVLYWICADKLEPSAEADAWDKAWWNCETEEYEDPPNDEDDDDEDDNDEL